MQFSSSLLPILLGGIIGYVTNDLAIKMLFRPYKPVYIGRFRLPFTPGIVARRQEEISVMLGREVEAQFFNASDLEILFQSDVFSEAVADSIADLLYSKRVTLCLTMETLQAREDTGPALESARRELCGCICDALQDFDFAPLITTVAEGTAGSRCADSLPRGAKNALTVFAPSLSDAMKQYFRLDGRETVEILLGKVLIDMGDRPVRDIIGGLFPDHGLLRDIIKELYRRYMAVYVRKVVGSIDVGGMITEKLRHMDPASIEKLILSVVRREFQYVVLLGGLLGMLIGTANLFL